MSKAAEIPAQNLDAEERVLGAILLAGATSAAIGRRTVDEIRATGLTADEFYRPSHGRVFVCACELADVGNPTDAVAVAAALEARGELEDAGGKVRIQELAALVPSIANVAHWARLVREEAERRDEVQAAQAIIAASPNGGLAAHPELVARLRRILDGRSASRRLEGLSHAQALAAEIPETRELVEGVIDCGTVGAIVGLPFARKSFVGQELGRKVAAGKGDLFGKFPMLIGGPVVYCWQDDSTAKMLERVQAEPSPTPDLPIRWLLNEGIRLPDDIAALREVVQRDEAVLVVLDSLYNFLTVSVKLKDEDVAPIVAALKSGICDPTGATVALIDHAPWPSEGNRGQRRAYGSVFKSAAVRWSIHLETDSKDDTRLHVEARGNNVAGFSRTPAYWDADAQEIRLVEPDVASEEELDARTEAFVTEHPGSSQTKVRVGVSARDVSVDASLERLKGRDRVVDRGRDGGTWSGQPGTPRYWYPADHAAFTPSQLFGTGSDEEARGVNERATLSAMSHPRRGDRVARDRVIDSNEGDDE